MKPLFIQRGCNVVSVASLVKMGDFDKKKMDHG